MRSFDLSRLRVLVVEDDRHMRAIYGKILGGLGVKRILDVADAASAREALAMFRPDFAVVDYELPGTDGIAFARDVRKPTSPDPFLPVLLVTGHANLDIVRRARDAGVTEIMRKPITVEGFYRRLGALIDSPRPFVRAPDYAGPCRRRHANIDYRGRERRRGEAEFRRGMAAHMDAFTGDDAA